MTAATRRSAELDDGLGELSSGNGAVLDGGDHGQERHPPRSPVDLASDFDPLPFPCGRDQLGCYRVGHGVLVNTEVWKQRQVPGQLQHRCQCGGVQPACAIGCEVLDAEPCADSRFTLIEQLRTQGVLQRHGHRLACARSQPGPGEMFGHRYHAAGGG